MVDIAAQEALEQLTQDCQQVETLREALIAERQALIEQDSEAIFQLAQQKQTLLQHIQQNFQRHHQHAKQFGQLRQLDQSETASASESKPASEAVTQSKQEKHSTENKLPESSTANHLRFKQHWQQYCEKLQTCQRLNEENGQIIQVKKGNLDRVISQLTGENNAHTTSYDADGHLHAQQPGRVRGKV